MPESRQPPGQNPSRIAVRSTPGARSAAWRALVLMAPAAQRGIRPARPNTRAGLARRDRPGGHRRPSCSSLRAEPPVRSLTLGR